MTARFNLPDDRQAEEVARIAAAYRERDAGGAEDAYRFANPGYAFYLGLLETALLDALLDAPVALEHASVLDIGCGSGYFAHRILEYGARTVTGIDLMPERIQNARRRYPTVRFEATDAAALPFPDHSFDIVTQFTCLSSILDPALRTAIATEMWRVLRPGGTVISWDMRPEPWPLRMRRSLRERRAGGPAGGTPTTGISDRELRRLFPGGSLRYESAGLDFELCALAARFDLVTRLLARLAPLRAHATGVVTKPPLSA